MAVFFPILWVNDSNLQTLLSGKTGAFSDKMFVYLRVDQSKTGAIDDMLYEFLGDLGYTGTIEERMHLWYNDSFSVGAGSSILPLIAHYRRMKEQPMQYLRQSTASQSVLIGPFVDSTDGVTAETGLTIANTDIRLSANGGNMAAKNSGGGTHDEIGYYTITLDATDTATVGKLQLACSVSGAAPVYHTFWVLEENVYDEWFAASAAAGTSLEAILTDTGTTIPGVLGTPAGADLATDIAAIDSVVDAVKVVTDDQANHSVSFTCDTGGSTTSVIFSSLGVTSIEDDQFNGRVIIWDNDTTTTALRGQATDITDYTHSSLTATVSTMSEAPASGDTGRIY